MTPEQMRRAATIIDGEAELWRLRGFGIAAREHADLARLLREQADATEVLHKLSIAQREVQAELQRMFSPPPPEGEK